MRLMLQLGMEWDSDAYSKQMAFVAQLAFDIIGVLKPQPSEMILDIGCGDGCLSEAILEKGAQVECIDLSAQMAHAAQARGIPAVVMDAHTLNRPGRYDAVFSNAALHWMRAPKQVFRRAYDSLKSGGRFVAEFGGYGNLRTFCNIVAEVLSEHDLSFDTYNPWYFPTAEQHRKNLESIGYQVKSCVLFDRPTRLPEGIDAWIKIVTAAFLVDIPESEQVAFIDDVLARMKPQLYKDGVWTIDYVRCRFEAHKP